MQSRALVGLAILLSLAGCARPVVLPPDSAPPAVVLGAYLEALQEGDCRAARALATQAFAEQTEAFCTQVRVMAYRVFATPATLSDTYVEFGLSLTTSGGGEALDNGSHTWFYSMVRQTGGTWRVDGGGSGP